METKIAASNGKKKTHQYYSVEAQFFKNNILFFLPWKVELIFW